MVATDLKVFITNRVGDDIHNYTVSRLKNEK